MIVVLAAVTGLAAVALLAGPLTRAVRSWWLNSRRLPVDVAYTAWFNAHSRCGEALQAWLAAAPAARPDAYRAYLLELELEEAAAAELESHAVALAA